MDKLHCIFPRLGGRLHLLFGQHFIAAVYFSCLLCCVFDLFMSDSDSSDTTHEAILHNVVSHVLHVRQQVAQIRTDLSQLSEQLAQLQASVQILVKHHESQISSPVEQKATSDQQD